MRERGRAAKVPGKSSVGIPPPGPFTLGLLKRDSEKQNAQSFKCCEYDFMADMSIANQC